MKNTRDISNNNIDKNKIVDESKDMVGVPIVRVVNESLHAIEKAKPEDIGRIVLTMAEAQGITFDELITKNPSREIELIRENVIIELKTKGYDSLKIGRILGGLSEEYVESICVKKR